MAEILIVTIAVNSFLLITYTGIFLYLIRLYRHWQEQTIGFWGLGSFLVAMALLFNLMSIIFIDKVDDFLVEIYFKLGMTYAFLGIWAFSIAHLMGRRNHIDLLGFAITSFILGILIEYIWNQVILEIGETVLISNNGSQQFNSFEVVSLLFYFVIYTLFLRDSILLYRASKRNRFIAYRKSIAITHFISWQFWAIGVITTFMVNSFDNLRFLLPLFLLLVPLITLGSRPFDWVREGFEPILLLLVDDHGTAIFSWTVDSEQPLFLEGSSIASIKNLLENFVDEKVQNMFINFEGSSLYARTSAGYLSLLITSGEHRSFEDLLSKIHLILVTAIIEPIDYEFSYNTLPSELKWLLAQLLPIDNEIDKSNNYNFSNYSEMNI